MTYTHPSLGARLAAVRGARPYLDRVSGTLGERFNIFGWSPCYILLPRYVTHRGGSSSGQGWVVGGHWANATQGWVAKQ